ncbi:APC family permease [Haloglycomyces albus]|uniref:APC family permease n=1 Tax=Haloglycomyces albus TaxID=526067 RepID=UPI00046C97A5|nr:APC family permease [Haloglycomyces albus]
MSRTQLKRELGLPGAVAIGMASMLGAGVFTVWGPAVAAAGSAITLLIALAIATGVAYCNADSSARLAARYPQSGGAYLYGNKRLNPAAGFLAGWSFLTGKSASAAAMALTLGSYLAPDYAKPLAVAAIIVLLAVNLLGIRKTTIATAIFLLVTLGILAIIITTGWSAGSWRETLDEASVHGTFTAAGLLFFAFAGYARLATLGEEVRRPQWTIPRAIPLALVLTVAVYLLVAATALHVLGSATLSESTTALADVAAAVNPALIPIVAIGAAVAATGVLLSLLAGMGRTALAMARDGWLPRRFTAVSERFSVPWVAEVAAATAAIVIVSVFDIVTAIGFSSFCVLIYYAVANASATTLNGRKVVPWLGLVGCLLMAIALPPESALSGATVIALGMLVYFVLARRAGRNRADAA